jgi:hypothetical protein
MKRDVEHWYFHSKGFRYIKPTCSQSDVAAKNKEGNGHDCMVLLPYLRVYKPQFLQEFTLQNWGAAYTRNVT